jgi:hypothetical protein
MQSVTLADNQEVAVTAIPEDSSENPSQNFVSATWVPADPTICSVNVTTGNQLGANVVALKPGTTTVAVTGNASAEGPTYTTAFEVIVTGGPATQFSFTFGTPTAQ